MAAPVAKFRCPVRRLRDSAALVTEPLAIAAIPMAHLREIPMRKPAASGRHVVVAELAFGQAFPLRHSWYERERKPMFEYVSRVVERVRSAVAALARP